MHFVQDEDAPPAACWHVADTLAAASFVTVRLATKAPFQAFKVGAPRYVAKPTPSASRFFISRLPMRKALLIASGLMLSTSASLS